VDERWWRFHNQPHSGAPTFDFQLDEAAPEQLAARCEWLQSAPESPFVLNLVCQRYNDGRLASLRGRVLKTVRGGAVAETRTLESEREFESVLREVFGIDVPDAPSLWPKVVARHEAWLRERGKT